MRRMLLWGKTLDVSVTGPQFEQMVRDVQNYIAQGDVVQVNLSVRQSKPLLYTHLMYEALRSFNPSPYMASIGSRNLLLFRVHPNCY